MISLHDWADTVKPQMDTHTRVWLRRYKDGTSHGRKDGFWWWCSDRRSGYFNDALYRRVVAAKALEHYERRILAILKFG